MPPSPRRSLRRSLPAGRSTIALLAATALLSLAAPAAAETLPPIQVDLGTCAVTIDGPASTDITIRVRDACSRA